MKKDSLIDVQNLSYTIRENTLIHELSFSIKKNEIVSVIGYNGSGKSTLVKLLLGSITTTSGTIKRKPKLKMGYVPQKLAFMQQLPLTAQDFLNMYNTSTKHSSRHVCSLLNIDSLLTKPLSGLSGGQLQKVLIYNALLGDPDILLLDEPTAGLDVIAQKEFYQLMEHISKEHGITMVLVSHDMHTVYNKSDTIICLHQGMCCTGCPKDEKFSQDLEKLIGGYLMPYLHQHKNNDR